MRVLRILARLTLGAIVLLTLAVLSRGWWLPKEYVVNVPLASIFGGAAPVTDPKALRAPRGFSVSRFATALPNARFLQVTEAGDVVVSQPRESKVTLVLRDPNHDGVADGTRDLLTGLDRPHGLALRDGWLYVAEMTAVGRIRFDPRTRETTGSFERVITGLPSGGNHWTRTIVFDSAGALYVSIGSSCNVCIEADERRAAILRYDPATWKGRVYASGLRNSVGLAWRRSDGTEELIATDNGRDLLGDDFPPCELNRIVDGGFYGWPFANGNRVPDPNLGAGHGPQIERSVPPIHTFAAHNAPLGLTFLDAASTPEEFRGAALVALHGSWNRSRKDGYKVVSLRFEPDGRITQKDFLTGFLREDEVSGRPVDVAQGPDGAVYITDDLSGSIFRVAPGEESLAATDATAGQAPVASASPLVLDPSAVARGLRSWEGNRCAQCHDPAQMAGADPKTVKVLRNLSARYDVGRMVTYLKAPQPPMPLFDLTDAERRDLAAFVLDRYR